MRNWVSGIVGIVWGGLIVIRAFVVGPPSGGGAYAAGAMVGIGVGVVMLLAGIYYVTKAINEPAATEGKTKKGSRKRKVRQSAEE